MIFCFLSEIHACSLTCDVPDSYATLNETDEWTEWWLTLFSDTFQINMNRMKMTHDKN